MNLTSKVPHPSVPDGRTDGKGVRRIGEEKYPLSVPERAVNWQFARSGHVCVLNGVGLDVRLEEFRFLREGFQHLVKTGFDLYQQVLAAGIAAA